MKKKYTISEITADTLKSSNVLQLVWDVFEEFVAPMCGQWNSVKAIRIRWLQRYSRDYQYSKRNLLK